MSARIYNRWTMACLGSTRDLPHTPLSSNKGKTVFWEELDLRGHGIVQGVANYSALYLGQVAAFAWESFTLKRSMSSTLRELWEHAR